MFDPGRCVYMEKLAVAEDLVSGDDVFFAATGVTGAVRIVEGRHHAVRSNLIRAQAVGAA